MLQNVYKQPSNEQLNTSLATCGRVSVEWILRNVRWWPYVHVSTIGYANMLSKAVAPVPLFTSSD